MGTALLVFAIFCVIALALYAIDKSDRDAQSEAALSRGGIESAEPAGASSDSEGGIAAIEPVLKSGSPDFSILSGVATFVAGVGWFFLVVCIITFLFVLFSGAMDITTAIVGLGGVIGNLLLILGGGAVRVLIAIDARLREAK